MRVNPWLAVAAVNGFVAVGAGAFAAHALKTRLSSEALQVFETGARYQMYHALAIGITALALRDTGKSPAIPAACFLVGIILFSGSLYLLALTGAKTLGIVTPFGGLAFLIGWAALAWSAMTLR